MKVFATPTKIVAGTILCDARNLPGNMLSVTVFDGLFETLTINQLLLHVGLKHGVLEQLYLDFVTKK